MPDSRAIPDVRLILVVTRFTLVSNSQDQDDIFGGQPAVLGNVAVATAREDKFPPALLGLTTQQRVIRQQFERAAHANHLLSGSRRILFGDEIEEALQIRQRAFAYFDARHARPLGRRAFVPATRPWR